MLNTLIAETNSEARGGGFLSIKGAQAAEHVVSKSYGAICDGLREKRELFLKEMARREASLSGRLQLTYKQKEALFFLKEFNGILSFEDKKALDGRALTHLKKVGLVEAFEGGLRLTTTGFDFVDELDQSDDGELESSFRSRCEELLGTRGWQGRLAKGLGISRQTVVKWTSGKLEVPEYVNALLEALESLKAQGVALPERFTS